LISSTTANITPHFTYEEETPPLIDQIKGCDEEYSVPSIVMEMKSLDLSGNTYSEIPQILFEIRHLTLVVESFNNSRGATSAEMLAFSKARSALEYRLLLMHTPVESADHGYHYVYEACRIAAVIYINYVLHEFDPIFRVLENLKRKLVETIEAGEDIRQSFCGRSEASLLLWALFMGGLLAKGDYDREWFVQRIAEQMMTLNLRSWKDVEECLMKALWIKRMRNSASEMLWKEALRCLERTYSD